ncbi:MAG: prolipoprotein diacylglyceryl transferase [bacterium]|nr:prolipoprotein diacylglyceryl transferase [bacterium]
MFNTKIPLYAICIIIAILSGLFFIYNNVKILKFKKEEIIGLLIYIGLGTIFGAKYFTFITNSKEFNGIFEFSKIGLSSYGAIIGIIILIFIFSKQYKKRFQDLVYVLLTSIPLMYSIGKIGCFVAGCCYGIKYNRPLSVTYNYSYTAPIGISLFPIQLLEAITFMIIFIYVFIKSKKQKPNNILIGKIFVICATSKFLLDYLRMSHVGKLLSINQLVSVLFILIGLYLTFKKNKVQ